MTTKTTSTLVNTADTLIPNLGSRWRSAEQIAQTYGRSRPWVYAIADRFKLRSVSLAETGKVGARLFDSIQMETLLEELAETQKGQPRVNPRAKTKEKALKQKRRPAKSPPPQLKSLTRSTMSKMA